MTMVDWLMESARVAGMATVSLELRAGNDSARRFYRALGFDDSAFIPGYYRGREMAVRMIRELRPADLQPVPWSMPKKL